MNNKIMQFVDTDGYKLGMWKQYPENALYAMSYLEARGGADRVKFFGLQYVLKQLQVPTIEEVDQAREFVKNYFGRDDVFNYEGWKAIAEMGYFPIRIHSVKEGGVYPTGEVLATIENTEPGFVWLIAWFETQIMRVWYGTNVATISFEIKELIKDYLERTGTPEELPVKLVDFGSRGASSAESAGIGGMAHMLNFLSTDTLNGIMYAQEYYDAPLVGTGVSIPASEHSTITSWGKDFETEAFRNMIEQFGGEGMMYACVSDSYDIFAAVDKWKELEPLILEKGGTLVIRPDSGDPVKTPVAVVEKALDVFGYTVNGKGYKVLPAHIRVIQGDGIDINSIELILNELFWKNISADNIAFGMGGALLQKHDRDTFKFAAKMSGLVMDDYSIREVFKDPITDKGKASKKGMLSLGRNKETGEFKTIYPGFDEGEWDDVLDHVYVNGELTEVKFEDIRNI